MRISVTKYQEFSDEKLMVALQQGEKGAFDEIYRRYADRLYGYFFKMLWYNEIRAQDLTQDLFTKVITKHHYYDASRSFKTWIFSVAANMCKNEFKRNEIRKNTKTGIDHLYYVSSDANLEKVIHEKQFKDALLGALDEMDEKHREVFVLKHMDGLSIKEISEIMEIQEGTVKSRLFYAIKRLANQLKVFENV